MKNNSSIYYLVIGCVFAFGACDKPVNGAPLTSQQKELTGRVWHIKSLTVPQINDPLKDSSIIQLCADSALMTFNSQGSFQLADRSKNGCDSIAVPYDKGIWELTSYNDSLLLKGKRTFAWKLEKLNDTLMTATFRDSISPSKSWLKKITLK